jgi:hypothetical protein
MLLLLSHELMACNHLCVDGDADALTLLLLLLLSG